MAQNLAVDSQGSDEVNDLDSGDTASADHASGVLSSTSQPIPGASATQPAQPMAEVPIAKSSNQIIINKGEKETFSNEELMQHRLERINRVKPVRIYTDLLANRKRIIAENRGRSGIYLWHYTIDNSFYVGKSKDLGNRLNGYFSFKKLVAPFLLGQESRIYLALLRFGYINFELRILEYCDESELDSREIGYILDLNPPLNKIRVAQQTSRFTLSEEHKAKISAALTPSV